MKTAADIGGISFGTAEARTPSNGGSLDYTGNSDKIPLSELERALGVLGEKSKRSLMTHIQVHDPGAKSNGYFESKVVNNVLHKFFGEASVLLMREIGQQ